MGRWIDRILGTEDHATKPTTVEPETYPGLLVSNKDDEEAYYNDVIVPLIKEVEKQVITDQPKRLDGFIEMHRQQCEGFSFSCERFGDFLTLKIVKLTNAVDEDRSGYPEDRTHYVTSINLADVRAITLKEGSPAKCDGEVSYMTNLQSGDEKAYVKILTHSSRQPPPPGFKHSVYANYAPPSPFRKVFVADLEVFENNPRLPIRQTAYYNQIPFITVRTDNIARSAIEDVIIFEGLGLVFFAPYGKGADFYNSILTALADGYTPKPLSADTL